MSYDATARAWNATGPAADWDTDGSWLAWLAGPGGILQVIDDLVRVDDDGNPPWSVLLDVDRCPTYALPWLGQLVGVRLAGSLKDAVMRQQIRAEQGWQRGTVAAIQAAVQPYLLAGHVATIIERSTDPYHLTISVFDSWIVRDTLGGIAANYATLNDVKTAFATLGDFPLGDVKVTNAALAAKPAGLILNVEVIAVARLRDLIPFGTLDDLHTTFATLRDIDIYVP